MCANMTNTKKMSSLYSVNYNVRLCQEEKAWPHLDLNSKCKFHILGTLSFFAIYLNHSF